MKVRAIGRDDIEAIVELSLLAWEPVFDSFERVLGASIYAIVYPDWRSSQREVVRSICEDDENSHVLVAEVEGRVVGLLAYEVREKEKVGETTLLAVHPEHQNSGIGTQLSIQALDIMRDALCH